MSMRDIQQQLKAPKSQFNGFGKYYYRSCEDIVEAVKPLLYQFGWHLVMTDRVIAVGDRVYVEATATVKEGANVIESATACARESQDKKGMDDSQITGTASSYARKYALNGLFAIDDTKDADSDEHAAHKEAGKTASKQKANIAADPDEKPWYNDFETHKEMMAKKIAANETNADEIVKKLREKFRVNNNIVNSIKSLESK